VTKGLLRQADRRARSYPPSNMAKVGVDCYKEAKVTVELTELFAIP
jgi:hypothetical protein